MRPQGCTSSQCHSQSRGRRGAVAAQGSPRALSCTSSPAERSRPGRAGAVCRPGRLPSLPASPLPRCQARPQAHSSGPGFGVQRRQHWLPCGGSHPQPSPRAGAAVIFTVLRLRVDTDRGGLCALEGDDPRKRLLVARVVFLNNGPVWALGPTAPVSGEGRLEEGRPLLAQMVDRKAWGPIRTEFRPQLSLST